MTRRREHAPSTLSAPRRESNPGPSSCEATALLTAPPCPRLLINVNLNCSHLSMSTSPKPRVPHQFAGGLQWKGSLPCAQPNLPGGRASALIPTTSHLSSSTPSSTGDPNIPWDPQAEPANDFVAIATFSSASRGATGCWNSTDFAGGSEDNWGEDYIRKQNLVGDIFALALFQVLSSPFPPIVLWHSLLICDNHAWAGFRGIVGSELLWKQIVFYIHN
jgi:hypothetical protein